ncbi:MAG: hypothetical protein AAF541_07825 [Pseudomonadota bacterium]
MELPHNVLLYILLLIAVAAGYLLGRRERRVDTSSEESIREYYQGLNVLLEERSELSVERFVRSAEVSEQTLDVHLAMAAVVRRRGEMEKGIAIHQNLLASTMLTARSKQLVEFELARDYQSAGLLDRAEQLLVKIIGEKTPQQDAAVELLIQLYEQERDWRKALDASKDLTKPDAAMRVRLAHFHFEMAGDAIAEQDNHSALKHIRRGVSLSPGQARGYWLRAQVEMQRRNYKAVRRFLQKAFEQQGDLVTGLLPLYRQACDAMEDDAGFESFLRQCLRSHPFPSVLLALQNHVRRNGGVLTTSELLEQMQANPQIGHVPMLIQLMQVQSNPPDTEARIEQITQQILKSLDDSVAFKCGECGFKSRSVTWHCPTCKAWGSFGQSLPSNSA